MKSRYALIAALSLYGCRGGESEQPPVHLIHNMDTQDKGRAYRKDTSGVFANGRVMQLPVPGTVALGQLDEDDLYFEGIDPQPMLADGGIGSKPDVTYKFPEQVKPSDGGMSDAVLARGENRYGIYCAPCHGPELDGKGPVAGKALDGGPRLEVPPANLTDARVKELAVGKIYQAIKNGVNNGNMPGYASQLPVEDRWAIVAYLRKVQGVGYEPGRAAEAVSADKVSLALGQDLYKRKNCNACHSLDGVRIVGPTWKGVYGSTHGLQGGGTVTVDDAYLKESIVNPMAKVVEGYPPAMPPQVPALTDIEIDSLILFIKAQK